MLGFVIVFVKELTRPQTNMANFASTTMEFGDKGIIFIGDFFLKWISENSIYRSLNFWTIDTEKRSIQSKGSYF